MVYAAAADRLPQVIAGVGAGGGAVIALAFIVRRPSVFPVGLVGVGAAYAVFLSLRSGAVDARAPVVAAALFVAAETGFWSFERTAARAGVALVARRIAMLTASAAVAALVGSLILVLATGVAGSVALEAIGVAAAAVTLAAIALLASRASV